MCFPKYYNQIRWTTEYGTNTTKVRHMISRISQPNIPWFFFQENSFGVKFNKYKTLNVLFSVRTYEWCTY